MPSVPATGHQPDASAISGGSDSLAALRVMRALLTAVENAGDGGLSLTRDAGLVALAREIVDGSGADIRSARTAAMALRDLVFRVDLARGMIGQMLDAAGRAEVDRLLSTDDIHALLASHP